MIDCQTYVHDHFLYPVAALPTGCMRHIKGGRRMWHFLKPLFKTHERSQKIIYSSEIWYGSCFFMFIKELWKNVAEPPTAPKTANCRRFFLPFLKLFETNLLKKKNTLTFALYICDIFWLSSKLFEISQVSNAKIRLFLNNMVSND